MRPSLDDPEFKYVPSYSTNLAETFRRAREEIKTKGKKMQARKVYLLKSTTFRYEFVMDTDWSIKDPEYLLIGTGSVVFKPVDPENAQKAQKVLALINRREAVEADLTEIDQQLIALRGVK